MAVNNLNFAATVDDWVKQTEQRMTAVFREATQRTVSFAQENLRTIVNVQTGFLRASPRASLSAMPPIDKNAYPKEGASYSYNPGQISLVIAAADIGETIYIGWTAAYAGFVHDGTSRMRPRPFVALAAQRWQITVNEVAEEAKARASRA